MLTESWTGQFRNNALKRIGEYEAFLESCGITPVAGTELEFHFSPQQSSYSHKLRNIKEFARSSFVEALKEDTTLCTVGEIAIGRGRNSRTTIYPKERYPSTIARATESARNILSQGGSKYGMDINFDENPNGERIRSLQCNISLWNSTDRTPLFSANPNSRRIPDDLTPMDTPNALTIECAVSLMEAQKALSALVSPHEASFTRYKKKESTFATGHCRKFTKVSAALRISKQSPFVNTKAVDNADSHSPKFQPSFYFEDRLASSEADPALAMLITLGGIVNGVRSYMRKEGFVDEHGIPVPEKMKAHINSPQFYKNPSLAPSKVFVRDILVHNFAEIINVPQNYSNALSNLKANEQLAKEIMGDEFYETFYTAYKAQAQRQRSDGRGI